MRAPLRAALAMLLLFAAAANAREVSLYVGVESDGKPVTGLTARNFRLLEDGQPMPFRIEPLEQPAQIVLVVESSQSSYPYTEDIDAIMQTFQEAAPEGNWYALVSFSRDAGVDQDFTRDKEEIAAAYAALGEPSWSDIDTYDAVHKVLETLERLPGRRAVIVIGSGYDTYSDYTAGDIEEQTQRSNVVAYAIGTGSNRPGAYSAYWSDFEHMHMLQGQSFLEHLAEDSGGRAWFPESDSELAQALDSVFADLNSRYRLVYDSAAPEDGKLHKVKVEAFQMNGDGREKLKVRVRKGWRSG